MTTKTQFTTELWNSFPEGKKPKAVTTDGSDVRILCTDSGMEDYPIVGIANDGAWLETWSKNGERTAGQTSSNADLHPLIPTFPPPPEGHQWHNPANVRPEDVPEGMRPTIVGEFLPEHYFFFGEKNKIPYEGSLVGWTIKVTDHTSCFFPLSTPFPDGSILQEDGSYKKPDPYAELKAAHAAGKVIQYKSSIAEDWRDFTGKIYWSEPLAYYRIKPETKLVPLGPWDVPPGSVFRRWDWLPGIHRAYGEVNTTGIQWTVGVSNTIVDWYDLHDKWQIKRPNEDWQRCSKEVEA